MQQAGYHHANILATQLYANIAQHQTEMLAMMQKLVIKQVNEQKGVPDEPQVQPATNATMEGSLQLQMLRILQKMQVTQNEGHNKADSHNGGGGNRNVNRDNSRDRSQNRNKKTPDNAAFQRADKSEYCWTHSTCNHKSGACNKKVPGHKTNVVLVNRMGVQTLFVGNWT